MSAEDFIKNVRADIRKHALIPQKASVLCAVSGGADSVSLLLTLHKLAPDFGWSIHAAHFNHGMRKKSDLDQQFVSGLCKRLSIPLFTERSTTLDEDSSEEQARNERLSFLHQTAESTSCSVITTGHTFDDRAETVFLNIIRGTGTDGLESIRWKSGMFVRPLLGRRRSEITSFLEEIGQDWCEDETNTQTRYMRNRIRHVLLPAIAEQFNPAVADALNRLAEVSAVDSSFMNDLAGPVFDEAFLEQPGPWPDPNALHLSRRKILAAHPALARRVVRIALEKLLGDLSDVTLEMCQRVLASAETPTPRQDIGLNVSVESRKDELVLRRQASDPKPFDIKLEIGDEVFIKACGCYIRVADQQTDCSQGSLFIRVPHAKGRLHVRSWRTGDRMRPRGLGGSKKLQDVFTDAKVPAAVRRRIPLICLDEAILWVPGVAVAEMPESDSEITVIITPG